MEKYWGNAYFNQNRDKVFVTVILITIVAVVMLDLMSPKGFNLYFWLVYALQLGLLLGIALESASTRKLREKVHAWNSNIGSSSVTLLIKNAGIEKLLFDLVMSDVTPQEAVGSPEFAKIESFLYILCKMDTLSNKLIEYSEHNLRSWIETIQAAAFPTYGRVVQPVIGIKITSGDPNKALSVSVNTSVLMVLRELVKEGKTL